METATQIQDQMGKLSKLGVIGLTGACIVLFGLYKSASVQLESQCERCRVAKEHCKLYEDNYKSLLKDVQEHNKTCSAPITVTPDTDGDRRIFPWFRRRGEMTPTEVLDLL